MKKIKMHFFVDEGTLNYLETKKPTDIHYLGRSKREFGKYLPRCDLLVPNYIIERFWEEPNEDF